MAEDNKVVQFDVDELTTVIKEQNEANLAKIGVEVDERISKALDERLQDFTSELKQATKKPTLDPNEDPEAGFKGFEHFCHDVWACGPDKSGISQTLKAWETRAKAAGSPSQGAGDGDLGGYLLPPAYANTLLQRTVEQSTIMQQAMILPMSTRTLNVPFLDGFNESQGKVNGNIEFFWKGEKAQYEAANFVLGEVELNLRKLTGLAYMTEELMKFAPGSAGALIDRAFAPAYNRALTRSFIRGTGAGQPLGFLNSPCIISVAKATDQAADTLEIENVVNMFARFYSESESGGGGTWMANKTTIPELLTMSLSVGTGGSAVYMNMLQDGPAWRILGDPVTFSSQMSTLGDEGDIAVCDWSQYLIGMSAGGPEQSQSIHLKFDYGQTAFKFVTWIDGQPWWKEPFQPEFGNTQSPFVTLAERA